MGKFTRQFNEDLIKNLKKTELFPKLCEDIHKGEVFPCIRKNLIEFYYKGSLLFKYNQQGFQTHFKYLINNNKKSGSYIIGDGSSSSKIEIQELIIDNFVFGYDSIKQTINTYAKPEATLTAGFYSKSFFKNLEKDDSVLFDIEAAFERPKKNDEDRKGIDKMDAVFFDKKQEQIVFCEVKRFNDERILSRNDEKAEVVGQLQRYETQIDKVKDDIITNYIKAFECYAELFGTPKYNIKSVYPKPILFVTGCHQKLYDIIAEHVDKIRNTGYEVIFMDKASGTVLNKIVRGCR